MEHKSTSWGLEVFLQMLGLLVTHALDLTLKLRLVTIQEAGGPQKCMCPLTVPPPLLPGLYVLHTKTLGPRARGHGLRESESQSIPSKGPIQPQRTTRHWSWSLVSQRLGPLAAPTDSLEENPAGFVSS